MSSFDDAIAIIAENDPDKAESLKALHKAEQEQAEASRRLQALKDEETRYDKAVEGFLNGGTSRTLGGKSI